MSRLYCTSLQQNRGRLALIVAALLVFASSLPLSAHGGGKQQLAREVVGPYRLYAWTSPDPWRVGQAHTTVAVTELLASQEETPATGVQVSVIYAQNGGQGERVTAIEQLGAQAGFYEADGPVTTTGDWQVTVEVVGPLGSGSAGFIQSVLPSSAVNWWLVGGGVLLVLLAAGYLGTRRTGVRPVQRGARL